MKLSRFVQSLYGSPVVIIIVKDDRVITGLYCISYFYMYGSNSIILWVDTHSNYYILASPLLTYNKNIDLLDNHVFFVYFGTNMPIMNIKRTLIVNTTPDLDSLTSKT